MDKDSVDRDGDNMNKYVGVLAEMTRRTHVMSLFLAGERNAVYQCRRHRDHSAAKCRNRAGPDLPPTV